MPKGSKLTDVERARVNDFHVQGLTQREIAAKIKRSKTVVCNFLKDPDNYVKAKLTGRPKINIAGFEQKDKKGFCEG